MVPLPYAATPFQVEVAADIHRLDQALPSDAFSDDVRRALYRYALIRNSWGTTNIDAGPLDLSRVEDLYEAYRRGVTRSGTILPDEREVVNYFRLVDDLPLAPFPVSVDDLRQLHLEYFRNVPLQNDAKPGRWKEVDNVVRSPWHVLKTTPKDLVEIELEDLLDWVNGRGRVEPVTVRAAVFFHGFQRIHPFGDGNGRLGRLAALWLLSIGGLEAIRYCPIDDSINENREEYYRHLAAADAGDLEAWVNYFGAEVRSGYQRATFLARRLQRLPPDLPHGSKRLLEWLYVHRVGSFRLSQVREFYLEASRTTVHRRLKELQDLGLVRSEGRGAGSRYFVASLHDLRTRGEP